MGVGAVALLYAAVRRCSGPAAGLIAGAALALTPVAALMFRYNNPDALLVLLLVAAAYCVVRATETASTRWMALAGCALGFAFLTKMLQAFLVAPGLGAGVPRRRARRAVAAHLEADGRRRRSDRLVGLVRRAGQPVARRNPGRTSAAHRRTACYSWRWATTELSAWSAGAAVVRAGASRRGPRQRPWRRPGAARGGAGNLFFGGDPGIGRLFGMSMGTEASWLLPAALIGLVAGLWLTRRSARTDSVRASLLLWGGWLLVSAAVFSFMDGTVHPYYTVALAPAIAALVGHLGARAVAGEGSGGGASRACGDVGGDRGLGVRSAGPHAGLDARAAVGRAGRIGGCSGYAGRRRASTRDGRWRYWQRAQSFWLRAQLRPTPSKPSRPRTTDR